MNYKNLEIVLRRICCCIVKIILCGVIILNHCTFLSAHFTAVLKAVNGKLIFVFVCSEADGCKYQGQFRSDHAIKWFMRNTYINALPGNYTNWSQLPGQAKIVLYHSSDKS